MKKLTLTIVMLAVLVFGGNAIAAKNPGGKLVPITTTTTSIMFSEVEGVRKPGSMQIYLSCADDSFWVGLWKYSKTGGSPIRVYTSSMYTASGDSIPVPANYILPLDVDVDFITLTAMTAFGDVVANWYKD